MASHYGLKISKWGPVTGDDEGHLYANATVTISPLYWRILLLQEGLPMIEKLPMRHWPRGLLTLLRMVFSVRQ